MKIHVGPSPLPRKSVPPTEFLKVISEMVKEHHDLEKVRETENTKRLEIERRTEVNLKRLESFEKLTLDTIRRNYDSKDRLISIIETHLEKTNDPAVIASYINTLIKILNTESIKEEIESIGKGLQNREVKIQGR